MTIASCSRSKSERDHASKKVILPGLMFGLRTARSLIVAPRSITAPGLIAAPRSIVAKKWLCAVDHRCVVFSRLRDRLPSDANCCGRMIVFRWLRRRFADCSHFWFDCGRDRSRTGRFGLVLDPELPSITDSGRKPKLICRYARIRIPGRLHDLVKCKGEASDQGATHKEIEA